jgi:uncharacterized damage-inducible protein DinB
MPMIDGFLAEYDQENAGTRKMLERYPEGKNDWKPHDKSMSLTQLAGHLSTLPNFAHMIATTEHYDMGPNDYKPFFPNTGKEAVERFDADSKKARDAMAKLSDADMHKNWIFSWQGKKVMELPRVAALRGFCFNHAVHHRGQLTVYYRLNGVPVPGLYGPSADDKGGLG